MTDRRLAIDAWESLFRAQHEVFGDLSDDFQDDSLNQGEYDVLLTVTRGENMTARLRDITANMLISQPSVSRLVDRMVVRGLISKCAAGGRAIAERMSLLSDDELQQLRELTAKLRKKQPSC
jgi:hypothetical protein